MRLFLIAIWFGFASAQPAIARPENIRHGYFTCTSCHVSPAGGGLLKAYGRMIASEKLVHAARENEDGFLHGAFEPSENWAIGGGIRFLQTYLDNEKTTKGQFFRMNSDIEGGVRLGEGVFKEARLWVAAKIGVEGGPEKTPGGERVIHRKISPTHYLQVEPVKGTYLRIGRFQTRFGLMIPDHGASVRRSTGLAAGSETRQVEATWNTRWIDLTISNFYKAKDRKFGSFWVDTAPSRDENGQALHASFLALEKYRLGFQLLQGRSVEGDRKIYGMHAALPFGKDWTLLHETDWVTRVSEVPGIDLASKTRSHLTWTKLLYELTPGVTPFSWFEATRPDMSTAKKRIDGVGLGIALKPRPHFNLDLASGIVLDRETYTYGINGRAVAHYWF